MKKITKILFAAVMALFAINANAAVEVTEVGGWFESGYVKWSLMSSAKAYNVYYKAVGAASYTKLDNELVREYANYGRADVVGIKAGEYQFKVVPTDATGAEMASEATETAAFTATAHDRGGFAHFKTASSTFKPANGIGAYKNDGTLKAGAKVIYVYADNAKTITTDVIINSKGGTQAGVGLQNIIDLYQKGYDTTPIDFRIIGTIKAENMDGFSSSAEGVQIKGRNAYSEMNITIEGIGNDAVIHGFGFLIRNACSVELRNFAVMYCMDDAVSMDTDNSNLWVHNLDLFYGRPGGAADQKKGDGTLDIKGDSKYCTLSYNHLWDNGKSSLCGMTSESGPNYLTYHHNWFDHSDSRHPRIRTMSVHVYNNYYDGNSKYGVGSTTGSDVFVENNYFRNCKYPMLTSKQGTDVNNGEGSSDQTKGTFSGEAGGSIKAYGNYMTGQKRFQPWTATGTNNTHFDAYVVENRDDKVPADVKALLGGDTYSNFDTDASLMYSGYTCHKAEDVPSIVTGPLGAGRCQKGDFTWTFGANEDSNDAVIQALSTAVQNYKSSLVGFFGRTVSNGGGTENQGGGSNEGSGDTGGGSITDEGGDNTLVEEAFLAGETIDDYFFFGEETKAKVEELMANYTITLVDGAVEGSTTSSFNPTYTYDAVANGKTFASTEHTGSLQLAKASAAGASDGGKVIFRCPKGVSTFAAYMYRTGSVYMNVYVSTDSVSWKKVATVEKAPSGIYEKNFSSEVADTAHFVYIKVENTSTGGLNLQGVRILNVEGATEKTPTEPGDNPGGGGDNGGNGGTGDNQGSENTLYKFTVKEIVSAGVDEQGATMNKSNPIATLGGTFVFGNVSKIEATAVAASGFGVKLDGNATATNSKYVQCNFDTPLKVGDVITLKGFATSTPSNNYGMSIYTDMGAAALASVYNTKKNVEESLTVTVDAKLAGVTTIYICRNADKSAYFTGIEVNGEKSTGIVCVYNTANGRHNGFTYNLFGQRTGSNAKGIVIIGGKKVLKK